MNLENGVYLRLFHGRKEPRDVLMDWGADGPIVGPFDGFHVTYMDIMRFVVDGDIALVVTRDIQEHGKAGDLFAFRGMYYGDWTVIDASHAELLLKEGMPFIHSDNLTDYERDIIRSPN